ncbi:MAG: leucine-rich repeat domain-containing protein, partial [Clostridia bacterium]|nr:leucine-rich repeat domain-containing protein [Clostridia bacterium]
SEYEPNTTVNGLQCYSYSSMMPTNFLYMVEEGEVDGTYYLRHQNDYARYLTFDQSAYEEKGQAVFSVKSEAGLWTIDEVDGEIRIRSYVNPDVYILGETNEYYNGDVSIFVNVGTSGSSATIFKSLKKYSGHTQTYKYYHYSSYSDTHCHRLYCVTCDKDGKYLTPCVFEEVVTPATCIANGYTTYTCVLCGFSYTGNETPAIAHTGKSCSTCGLDFALRSDNASLEIHGTNSNFNGGDVILPATAIVPGLTNGEAMPIKTVGAGDFGDTNDWIGVTTLVIPEGVEYIGGAFYNFDNPNKTLTSVVIPDTVKSIGSDAFYGCINLKTVEIGVNSKLEYIGEYAFFATGIESIFIPKTVTSIDFDAFDYSNLTDIYYAGTEEEFATIVSVDLMLSDLPDNATIHYNYVAEE